MSKARGTVVKRGSSWSVVLDFGRDETGKRLRKWHSGYRTKKLAEQARTDLLGKMDTGMYIEPSAVTLSQFLTDQWLPAISTTIRATTRAMYTVNIEAHIVPSLGNVKLSELSAPRLNAFYASMLANGRRDGKGGLSTRTVRINHVIIHRALRDAVRWGLLSRNIADLSDPPAVKSTEAPVWSPDEMKRFLETQREDRLVALWRLVAATGMRRGEVLGLRWSDVDLEAGSLRISQTLVIVSYALQLSEPKTAAGRRTLMLDPATVAALKGHRKRQLEERMAWGAEWKGKDDLVFVREDGSMIHPERLSTMFNQRVTAAKLPRITFHGCRHSYVTMLLRSGQPIRAVSARVGHASANVTNAIYSHVLPGDDKVAALAGAALLGS